MGSEMCIRDSFTGDYPIPVQLEMDKLALETMPVGQRSYCEGIDGA